MAQIHRSSINIPKLDHINNSTELNHKWQKELSGSDASKGFLSAAFSEQTFRDLADKSEIVIGTFSDQVISYYLVNSISKDRILIKHVEIFKRLKTDRAIKKESKVAYDAQALVDLDFEGSALRKMMLTELAKLNTKV